MAIATARGAPQTAAPRRHPRRWPRALGIAGAIVAAALVVARLAAPELIRQQIVEALASADGYRGSLQRVDLRLSRGEVVLRELAVWPTSGSERPTATIPETVVSIDPSRSVRERRLVVKARLESPTFYFREGEVEPPTEPRTSRAAPVLPLVVDQVVASDATLIYRSRSSPTPVDLRIEHAAIVVDGIALQRETAQVLPRNVWMRGAFLGSGTLDVRARGLENDVLEVDASLEGLDLVAANETIRDVGGIEVARGVLDLYISAVMYDGSYVTARVRPFVSGLQPIAPRANPTLPRWLWARAVDVGRFFVRDRRDTIAGDFTIEGYQTAPGANVVEVAASFLSNAFIQELIRGTRPPSRRRAP